MADNPTATAIIPILIIGAETLFLYDLVPIKRRAIKKLN
jgi:hypothetical protein